MEKSPVRVILTALLMLFLTSPSFASQEAFSVKKQPELQQIKPKKPVKIRLKRTARDEYSWELSGDDADDIVRADQRLRRLLNIR